MKTSFCVEPDEAGLRLDQVIPRHVAGLSRRKARAVIDLGGVFVDRTRVKVAGRTVRAGQRIEVNVGGAVERAGEPPLPPRIVHVDEHVIVVDKPAGLVTAPTPEASRGDLLDQLGKRFGEVTTQTIDRPIDRRRAVTHVEPLESLAGATLLAVRLETGRTHQIRIHLAGIQHPVCGDRAHGGELERAFLPRPPRLALHAAVLGFTHPATGARVRWESPVPDELARWIARLRPETSTP